MQGRAWLADRRFPAGESYPHGTRSRYVQAKCRCDLCRAANRVAYHDRARRRREAAAALLTPLPSGAMCPGVNGEPCPYGVKLRKDSVGACETCSRRLIFNGLVDAAPARAHLRRMSKKGIGYRSVADAARVADSTMAKIWTGKRKLVRAQLLQRILAVDESVRPDGCYVAAGPTWRRIRALVERGWTKGEIAIKLGRKMAALQIRRDRVRLSTAAQVKKLYETLGDPPQRSRRGPAPLPCRCERPIPIRDRCARCERALPAGAEAAA